MSEENLALKKTNELVRKSLQIKELEPNSLNPNEMGEAEFNLLYDNVEKAGLTDPILCRPLQPNEIKEGSPARYRIVGGHHRWEIAKLHGFEEVPCTIIVDPEFNEDAEKFQMVRHNIIRGKMSPQKFVKLYESLSDKYAEDVAAELFGFSSEEEFQRLVQSTAKALPKELQQEFKDAAKEIKTIDDLATLLNRLFAAYGDTVPYGFMIFDFGGNDHIWLRMEKKQKVDFTSFSNFCIGKHKDVAKTMTVILQLIAKGELSMSRLEEEMAKLPDVEPQDYTLGDTTDFDQAL